MFGNGYWAFCRAFVEPEEESRSRKAYSKLLAQGTGTRAATFLSMH